MEMEILLQEKRVKQGFEYLPLQDAMASLAERLPKAELAPLKAIRQAPEGELPADDWRAVIVKSEPVAVVSRHYQLVQHFDAFLPVLQGLEQAGEKTASVRLGSRKARAWMDVLVGDQVADSVRIGYRVSNAHDGKHALQYGFSAEKVERGLSSVQMTEEVDSDSKPRPGSYRYIEVVGFRQICSNGMKVRIPLASANPEGNPNDSIRSVVTEVWKEPELIEQVQAITASFTRIVHMGQAQEKAGEQREAVKLLALLRAPVQRLIERAQARQMDVFECLEAFDARFGKRVAREVKDCLEFKDYMTAWDAYNAMTDYATRHARSAREAVMVENKAADFLIMLQARP